MNSFLEKNLTFVLILKFFVDKFLKLRLENVFLEFLQQFPKFIKEKMTNYLRYSICIIKTTKSKDTLLDNDHLNKFNNDEKIANFKLSLSKFSGHRILSHLNGLLCSLLK